MEHTISLVKEELDIGKRTVETGRVRIAKRVEEHEQIVELPLRHDEVQIERVTFNREVTEAQGPRHEGDVMIVPIYEEVLVVTRKLILKEEMRISRSIKMKHNVPEKHTLRTEKIDVTRVDTGDKPD